MSDRVLITGATGFIGGWVAEVMQLTGSHVPVAGFRTWPRAVRVARHGVKMRYCDVLDKESLRAAMAGCRYAVNAAVGDDEVTIRGMRNVADVAHECGIERLVHLSSVAVYGRSPGVYRETDHPRSRLTPYAQRKLAAEIELRSTRVPWTILRPTIVYGPFSQQWTTNIAQRLAAGRLGNLGPSGEGICNLVYVEDVVEAVRCALSSGSGADGVYNVNGPDSLDWNGYFRTFAHKLGLGDPVPVNPRRLAARASLLSSVRRVGTHVLANYRRQLVGLSTKSSALDRRMRSTESQLRLTPTPEQFRLYGRSTYFPGDAVRDDLSFVPMTPASVGIDLAAQWVLHHRLIEDWS